MDINKRNKNIEVFKRIQKIYTDGYYINGRHNKVIVPPVSTSVYLKSYENMKQPVGGNNKTSVKVDNLDTFAAARLLTSAGFRPMVLNMASKTRPGGGVRTGATAQEECLCRSSNLLPALEKFSYKCECDDGFTRYYYNEPLEGVNAIYSSGITVITDERGNLLDKCFSVDVITIPCININGKEKMSLDKAGHLNDNCRKQVQEKVEMILRTAYHNGNDSLVLGAFGCGVFACPPEDIASIFKEVLERYNGVFRNVYFAVLDKTPAKNNFNAFCKVFGE